MKPVKTILPLYVLILLLVTLCSGFAEDLPVIPSYTLSENGEAVIDDVSFPVAELPRDQNRVFYEIFVGSFSDSDGDGIGDLRGIINRMDYLNDGDPYSGTSLGIEGIWLTPVFSSPSYHKYDVADFYSIDPAFGTMDDLQELIRICHERDVLLILDLPINHTSKANLWFTRFAGAHQLNNPSSIYYDLYSWYPEGSALPAGRAFSLLPGAHILYESNFSDSMPELNFDNELTRTYALDVARFYLEMGVDGFRFDAAKYIDFGNHPASVSFWTWYLEELRKINPDVYTIAEVWDSDNVTDLYAPVMNCFNFTASQTNGLIAETAKAGNVNRFTSYIQERESTLKTKRPEAMNCLFIANHDTDRAAGYLTAASGYMKTAANLYLLSPGSPYIYYGEEIGLRGSRGGANTDANRRLAMLWGDGDTVQDPVGTTYQPSKQTPYSVKDLMPVGNSLLTYYKRLLMIRKANPEIARGEYQALSFANTKLGGFISTWNGSAVAVLHNTTLNAITLDLSQLSFQLPQQISAVIGLGDCRLDDTSLVLDSQTSVVLRSEKQD